MILISATPSNILHTTKKSSKETYEMILMKLKEQLAVYHRLLDMLNELTFIGVAMTNGASGESVTANLSCINRLSTMESSLRTIL